VRDLHDHPLSGRKQGLCRDPWGCLIWVREVEHHDVREAEHDDGSVGDLDLEEVLVESGMTQRGRFCERR
jgi:hypothetical protein